MRGVLNVKLISASGLTDSDGIGNKSDPYVRLSVDSNQYQQSTTKSGTLNPVFNETFQFFLNGDQHVLYVECKDKDLIHDDKLGKGKLDIRELFSRPGQEVDYVVELKRHIIRSGGRVNVRIQFLPQY
ncbi:hypothetical protein CXG81DRAFT_12479 [Caulochytrium protostelioides]|uniref:C2 domain-containing protein n=1 Tax=Caulochytrium protostelioides TaxID=1555241 RepID=A0A4P9X757_9FUNG|nr:hypothetical protein CAUPRSCDRAFT_10547 [Caulochytrium protostelioides]RKP01056.1 hypothetical protein CXG81DRAFT_12479 [Caulochytrium protostelioides]|eukprot:RKP01056.1 hypothetical protein CXG81DRAFT_12479 [Caulochytrium protostelioides]